MKVLGDKQLEEMKAKQVVDSQVHEESKQQYHYGDDGDTASHLEPDDSEEDMKDIDMQQHLDLDK